MPLISCSDAQRKQISGFLLVISLISPLGFFCCFSQILWLMRTYTHRAPFPFAPYLPYTASWVECWGRLVSLWNGVDVPGTARCCVRVCFCLRVRQTEGEEVRFLERELIRVFKRPDCRVTNELWAVCWADAECSRSTIKVKVTLRHDRRTSLMLKGENMDFCWESLAPSSHVDAICRDGH